MGGPVGSGWVGGGEPSGIQLLVLLFDFGLAFRCRGPRFAVANRGGLPPTGGGGGY